MALKALTFAKAGTAIAEMITATTAIAIIRKGVGFVVSMWYYIIQRHHFQPHLPLIVELMKSFWRKEVFDTEPHPEIGDKTNTTVLSCLHYLSADDVSVLNVFITGTTDMSIASMIIIARERATLDGVIEAKYPISDDENDSVVFSIARTASPKT